MPAADAFFCSIFLFSLSARLYLETSAHGFHFRWNSWTRLSGNHSITWSTRSRVEHPPMEESLLVSTDLSLCLAITSQSFPSISYSVDLFHPAFSLFCMSGRRAGMYDARHEHVFITLSAYLFLLPRSDEPGVQAVRIVRPTTVDRLTS